MIVSRFTMFLAVDLIIQPSIFQLDEMPMAYRYGGSFWPQARVASALSESEADIGSRVLSVGLYHTQRQRPSCCRLLLSKGSRQNIPRIVR